jgi:hypothetical protein
VLGVAGRVMVAPEKGSTRSRQCSRAPASEAGGGGRGGVVGGAGLSERALVERVPWAEPPRNRTR